MNKKVRFFAAVLLSVLLLTAAGCNRADPDYGVVSEKSESAQTGPAIHSNDRVMGLYLDISLYDEENYADVYLGKGFKTEALYGGGKFGVPATLKELEKNGWQLETTGGLTAESTLLPEETRDAVLVNTYGKKLDAVFYNRSDSTVKLGKCRAVRLGVPENCMLTENSAYDQFWINGVGNTASITDIIHYFGNPSHFHGDGDLYTLDYFLRKDDRRNKVTFVVDTKEDSLVSFAVSAY